MNRRSRGPRPRSTLLVAIAVWTLILGGCSRFDACEVGRGCRTLEPLESLALDLDAVLGWDGAPSELIVRLARLEPEPGRPPAAPVVPDGTEFRASLSGLPRGTTLDGGDVLGPRESVGPHQEFDIGTLAVGRERSIRFTLPDRDPEVLRFAISAWNFDLGYLRGSLVVSPPLF